MRRDVAEELSAIAQRMAGLAPGKAIDWSDDWSESDMQEFTAASLRRLEAEEEEERRLMEIERST